VILSLRLRRAVNALSMIKSGGSGHIGSSLIDLVISVKFFLFDQLINAQPTKILLKGPDFDQFRRVIKDV
jgi:hypothetical protein